MNPFLRKNPKITPKMPEYSPAILTKSYVEFYKNFRCREFLKEGKAFRVIECGFYEYDYDENYRKKGLKNNIEWCEIEIMDRSSPPDCCDFFVKADDLNLITRPNFKFE